MGIKKPKRKPRLSIHLEKKTMAMLNKESRATGLAKSTIVEYLLARAMKTPGVKKTVRSGHWCPSVIPPGPSYAHTRARELRAKARASGKTISNQKIVSVLNKKGCLTRYGKDWDANKVSQQRLGLPKRR